MNFSFFIQRKRGFDQLIIYSDQVGQSQDFFITMKYWMAVWNGRGGNAQNTTFCCFNVAATVFGGTTKTNT